MCSFSCGAASAVATKLAIANKPAGADLVMTIHYGCWNEPRSEAYHALNGRSISRMRDFTGAHVVAYRDCTVIDVLSKDCKYDGRAGDRKCEGCVK